MLKVLKWFNDNIVALFLLTGMIFTVAVLFYHLGTPGHEAAIDQLNELRERIEVLESKEK